MTARVYFDRAEWPGILAELCRRRAGATVVLVQAEPHWLTDESAVLRDQVERALASLLFDSTNLRVGRVLLYDPPGTHLAEFVGCDLALEPTLHASMTESLRDWLRVVDMWSTLFTTRRHMKRERSEAERYQVKSWVVAKLTDADAAKQEAALVPRDMLAIGEAGAEFSDLYRVSGVTDQGWAGSRLLWTNAPASGLDPTVGRRGSEILAAGAARFFSVDVTAERWWGDGN